MGVVIAIRGENYAGRDGRAPTPREAPADDHFAAETKLGSRRATAARRAALDWMETQARVLGQWRAVMVEIENDAALMDALDAHASFLAEAAARLR